MVAVFVAVVVIVFLVYRGFTLVRSVKARRAGDRERADELRTQGIMAYLGVAGIFTLALLVLAAVAIARS